MAERDDVVWEDAPRRRPRDAGARVAGWVLLVAALGVISALVLLATEPAEPGEPLDGIPREVAGRWATADARFADRRLVIERDRVELQVDTGPEGRLRHAILEVRGWTDAEERGYRIRYQTPEGEQTLDVFVAEDGALRLKNPPDVVWRRVP